MHYFFAFWWLIFPVSWFVLAAWSNWLSYRRRKDELETLKHMAASGKEPPPELLKAVSNPAPDPNDPHPYDGYGYGWRARRYGRWGPFWEWRRAIFFGAVAAGLYYWASYEDGHTSRGIMIAVTVMGVLAVASALTALVMTLNPPK